MPSSPKITGLLFDDENEDKIWDHGLTAPRLLQVLESNHVVKRNRKRRRAKYLLVGRDFQGQCIAIPVEPTNNPEIWRPITAWLCKDSEENWCPDAK